MVCSHPNEDLLRPKRTSPENTILSAIAKSEFKRIEEGIELISFNRGTVLFDQQERIEYAYFPRKAMISLVSVMNNGDMTEISIVGKEGMVGLPLVLSDSNAGYQAIVQIPGDVYRIEAEVLKQEFCRTQTLHDLLLRYTQAFILQISQTAVANAKCDIESRLAQWLLIVQDSIGSNYLPLTQEFMAEMLGTRRSSVSVAANKLQKSGTIQYSRGNITILSREKLEQRACECYYQVHSAMSRLMQPST